MVNINRELIEMARLAAEKAYAPYSNFKVGSALIVPDGKIYTGCNIENASYGLTICSERSAIFKAVSEGYTEISKLAVTGPSALEAELRFRMPCGACRQVMSEFMNPNSEIIIDGNPPKVIMLEDLLPDAFSLRE